MNFKELEASLNLTFHDSLLHDMSTDFVRRTAEFVLNVCVGDPEAPTEAERERRRTGQLELTGLHYLVIDPPDPDYPSIDQGPVDVDSCDPDPKLASRYRVPADSFSGRFFVSDWNAFIHFAAKGAALSWLEPE